MNELLRAFLHLPEAASPWAESVDRLHFVVIGITMFGAAGVFLTAGIFVLRFRRRGGPTATTPVRMPRAVEVSVAVGLLSLFLVLWLFGFRQYVKARVAPEDALVVQITGKQWMWKVVDATGRSAIGVVVVPADRDVRLVLTSRDVIHSFYVPALRMKQDAVPGAYTSMWFRGTRPGVYPVYCAEYCGLSHSRMAAALVVLTPEDYAAYEDNQIPAPLAHAIDEGKARNLIYELGPPPDELIARGLDAATRHACLTCHTLDGRRAVGPSWRGIYHSEQPLEGGGSVKVTEEYVIESVLDPRARVVRGFEPVMPTYRGQLSDADLQAIVALIRSLEEGQ